MENRRTSLTERLSWSGRALSASGRASATILQSHDIPRHAQQRHGPRRQQEGTKKAHPEVCVMIQTACLRVRAPGGLHVPGSAARGRLALRGRRVRTAHPPGWCAEGTATAALGRRCPAEGIDVSVAALVTYAGYGPVAQRERASLAWKRSGVRFPSGPPMRQAERPSGRFSTSGALPSMVEQHGLRRAGAICPLPRYGRGHGSG